MQSVLFLVIIFFVLLASTAIIGLVANYYRYWEIEPSFLGSIIGAAGTIFAAAIAYVAVDRQIEQATIQADAAQEQMKRFAREQKIREMQALEGVEQFLTAIIEKFSAIPDDDVDGFRDTFIRLSDAAELPLNLPTFPPDPFGGRARLWLERINNLRATVTNVSHQRRFGPGPERVAEEWRRANDSVRETIERGRDLIQELRAEIQRRRSESAG